MGQKITMSVETLSTYLSINNEGDKYHTGTYDTSLSRPNDYVGNDMDIHEHILHIIFHLDRAPTNKYFGFRHIYYWMWHFFRTDHPLNLASIIFLNLIEIVRLPMSRNETVRYAQASTVPLVDTQSSDAPRSSHEAYPALPTPPSPLTICLLKVINGPSLQVNARVNALTAYFDDRYNQLDKRINELASWFPPPSDD
ncbi:hypothetical protein Gorai_014647 [Gossypium raimondii]|uniref:Uncharacterized protein n=1 Tax=Gossypium raimondii TaxID=29730 RepID=A0A7J8P3L3_GOSRA|nr:hypothetical protein [Gossypium raimondii]